jgi:OmcA/MtrC family decaheme c-type cytochrome
MIKSFKMSMRILIALSALGLLFGCSSGHKEGSEQTTTISPSTEGNIQATITGVTVSSPPVVTFALHDEIGNPLDPNDVLAAGGRARFTIAQIAADGNYKNYVLNSSGQPAFDSGGVFATVSPGTYTYTFKTDITINPMYDPTLTHTVGAQIQRNITSPFGTGFQQAVNPYFNFRPDGQPVSVTREVVATSNCNECHGKLGIHGGGRRDVALCILCHNPQLIDTETGNSINMKVLIHKIHYGENLPSNLAGGAFAIGDTSFADVTFPFISGDSTISGRPVQCTKCHRAGKDVANHDYGRDVDKYKTPTRANCTTCHDLTTFDGSTSITVKNMSTPVTVTATPHTGGPQSSDAACAACHPQTGAEFGASITGAHTIIEQSSVFKGINFQILSVSNATPGNTASVTFKVTDDTGAPVSLTADSASFNLKLGYPTADYTNNLMENYGQPLSVSVSAATGNPDGSYTKAFTKPIPANAVGIGVVGMEGRKSYTITSLHKGTASVRIGGQAVQYYFDLATGAQVTDPALTRRKSVDINKCIACHTRLSLHGSNRVNSIEECVICHNADATDKSQRPADPSTTPDGLAERSIHLKTMIHSIHTGQDLNVKPFVVYGFGGSVNDFSDVTYPRDRRECIACHISSFTSGLPLPAGALGTTVSTGAIPNNDSDNVRKQPISATCTSCHDSVNTATHVADKMSGGKETCLACHTSGLLLGADNAHFPTR